MFLIWTAIPFLVLAIYPFVIYPLTVIAFSWGRRRRTAPRDVKTWPRISIVFCAFNEEKSIADKLSNCIAAMRNYAGTSETLIYLDGCTDNTEQILREHPLLASTAARVQIISGRMRAGKSHGINALLASAQGEIVVFTDANVTIAEDSLAIAAECLADPKIGCVCSNLTYINPGASPTALAGSLYWRFEEWLKQRESDVRSTVGADGSLFALRRALFRPVPDDIIDDMFTTYGAFIQGFRVIREPKFRSFEKHAVSAKDEFRRKVRIACRAVNCMRLLWPELRTVDPLTLYMVVAHKILRYFTIFFLAIGIADLAAGLLVLHAYLTVLTLLGIAAAALLLAFCRVRPFDTLLSFLEALTAVGLGVIASLRGERYQTWTIPDSSRKVGELSS